MRRIGLYSDVHANLPALQAVLDHMQAEGITERYCLGDLVGYGPHPVEVIARMRAIGDTVVQGNFDRALGARLRDSGSNLPTPQETLDAAESYAYTIAAMSREDERYLSALPREIVLEIDGVRILLCHGTPRRMNEIVAPDAAGSLLVSLVRGAGVDAVCCGHVHVPFHRSIPTEAGVCHWVNAGSVGRPRDGDPRAAWVELALGTHQEVLTRAVEDLACRRVGETDLWLSAHLHRVAYDTESVVRDTVARGLPATLASALSTGSETRHTLSPSSVSEPHDHRHGHRDGVLRRAFSTISGGASHGCGAVGEGRQCTCALGDRIAAYECFAALYRDPPASAPGAAARLATAMRSCRKNPHLDDRAIEVARDEALHALERPAGLEAFAAERVRLHGEPGRFDPFVHVLSPSELTYLAGDEAGNAAGLEALYAAAGFTSAGDGSGDIGHISVELAFMAHCLRRGPAADSDSLGLAHDFFVGHLADWAVLLAVVTAQQATEPVMRYVGLALDKYLICEAGTFRAAVPEYCEMRERGSASGVLSSARTDGLHHQGGGPQ
ncbi:MAG: metallophosphoesterase family protein [Coriobacteriia bacterium]|nr:metallophosphoesterase family protein [Coriobacteriia bacterium]